MAVVRTAAAVAAVRVRLPVPVARSVVPAKIVRRARSVAREAVATRLLLRRRVRSGALGASAPRARIVRCEPVGTRVRRLRRVRSVRRVKTARRVPNVRRVKIVRHAKIVRRVKTVRHEKPALRVRSVRRAKSGCRSRPQLARRFRRRCPRTMGMRTVVSAAVVVGGVGVAAVAAVPMTHRSMMTRRRSRRTAPSRCVRHQHPRWPCRPRLLLRSRRVRSKPRWHRSCAPVSRHRCPRRRLSPSRRTPLLALMWMRRTSTASIATRVTAANRATAVGSGRAAAAALKVAKGVRTCPRWILKS